MSGLTAWCDACAQEALLKDDGTCAWCDGPTRKKRGGGKPKGKYRRATEAQLRAAHKLYVIRGLSCRQLGELLWEKLGYKTPASCGESLHRGFVDLGLPRRSQSEVTVTRNFKHGRKRRELSPEDEKAYRVWLSGQRGWNAQSRPGQWQCVAVKLQAPRKGERCRRPSLGDSDYCQSHDPRRELARQAATAAMRRRLPPRDLVPIEPFAAYVEVRYGELGTLAAVAAVFGCSTSTVCDVLRRRDGNKRPKTTVGRPTVQRWLTREGRVTLDALYPDLQAAAA